MQVLYLIYCRYFETEFNMLCDRQFSDPIIVPPAFLMPDLALAWYSRSSSDCFASPDTESDDSLERDSQNHRDRLSPRQSDQPDADDPRNSVWRHKQPTPPHALNAHFLLQGDLQVDF